MSQKGVERPKVVLIWSDVQPLSMNTKSLNATAEISMMKMVKNDVQVFVQISQEYIYIHISIFRWLILVHVHAFWKYSSNVKCLWYECLKGLDYYLNWWINDETESITACSIKRLLTCFFEVCLNSVRYFNRHWGS